MERTSDLDALKGGEAYTWGQVIAIHEVGPYSVVEYHPWKATKTGFLTGVPDLTDTDFATYVEGRNCSHSYPTLDAALAGCMAYRAEGPNHRADIYFIRSLRP